jgi:colicin import membrane protein
MRIKFKQPLSGPDYSFAPGETAIWDKHELVRLCAAGIGEPGDAEAASAMQEAVDEENARLKKQTDDQAAAEMQATADAEAEAEAEAEIRARAKTKAEAKMKADADAKAKLDAEALKKAEAETKEKAVKPAPETAAKP